MRLRPLILVALFFIFSLIVCLKIWSDRKKAEFRKNQLSFQQDSIKVDKYNSEAFSLRLKDPKKAISISKQALVLALKNKYREGAAQAYWVIGLGQFYIGNRQSAIDNYSKALHLFNRLKNYSKSARVYNSIGNIYREIDYHRALHYLNLAMRHIPKNDENKEMIAGINFNLGTVYLKSQEPKKALIYFEKANQYYLANNDTISKIHYLQNSGRAYYQLEKYSEAKNRLLSAVSQSKMYEYNKITYSCYFTLIEIYIRERRYLVAEEMIVEALDFYKKNAISTIYNQFLYSAFELEMAKGNKSKALAYLIQVYKFDSTQLDIKQSTNIDITSVNYIQQSKLEDNKAVIAKTKSQSSKNHQLLIAVIAFSILAILTAIIFYILQQKKRKKERFIMESEMTLLEQKAIRAMMNPHFIFNVMTSIQQFINIADQHSANKLLSGFASLIRKHLELSIHPTVSLNDEIEYLKLYLAMEHTRFGEQLNYQLNIDDKIDLDEIMIPSMLIQPFVENAIWHGIMPLEENGQLDIEFNLLDNFLYITVLDNGVGILNSQEKKKSGHISRGMELTKSRVNLMNKLNARAIEIKQEQLQPRGTRVQINLPV